MMDKKEIARKFMDLACQLSPENLSCDGELSPKQIKFRRQVIQKEWEYLEGQLGRKVTEDDVWSGKV